VIAMAGEQQLDLIDEVHKRRKELAARQFYVTD
jgi:hypothetical protein